MVPLQCSCNTTCDVQDTATPPPPPISEKSHTNQSAAAAANEPRREGEVISFENSFTAAWQWMKWVSAVSLVSFVQKFKERKICSIRITSDPHYLESPDNRYSLCDVPYACEDAKTAKNKEIFRSLENNQSRRQCARFPRHQAALSSNRVLIAQQHRRAMDNFVHRSRTNKRSEELLHCRLACRE